MVAGYMEIVEFENSINFSDEVNVAKYARDTIHKKGEKLFTRIGLNIYNNWNQCSKFKTKDDAQRKFLKSGSLRANTECLKNLLKS